MVGSRASNIDNVPATNPIYLGAVVDGRIKFAGRDKDNSIGYDVRRPYASAFFSIGPGSTLALGLTERCARLGKGRVYYFCKATYDKDRVGVQKIPESYVQLPDLLYVDYEWTNAEVEAWFRRPHWQRLDLLSGRACTIGVSVATLPITLCYEQQDYNSIQFFKGLGQAILYYNLVGFMYLGFMDDLCLAASYVPRLHPHRSRWMALKTNVAHFQMRSGAQAVEELRAMYFQQRPGSLFVYGSVIAQSLAAHQEWVAAGGYSIEADPHLGQKIVDRAARARARLLGPPAATAEEVEEDAGLEDDPRAPPEEIEEPADNIDGPRRLREEVANWSDAMQRALESFTSAANVGMLTLARFTARDEDWVSLTADEKDKIIDTWELEQEEAARGGGPIVAA